MTDDARPSPYDDPAYMRGPVLGAECMVASEHPLVSQTGLAVLRDGGNAFDAAIAMSALLPVVKPGRSHLGGDAYILACPAGAPAPTAICSGGMAPAAATIDLYAERTSSPARPESPRRGAEIPNHGGLAAAVPGLVDAWSEFHARWCTMPLADLLAPAVRYARDGFPVSRELALTLANAKGLFTKYTALADALYIDGRPPRMGETLRQPGLAGVIEAIGTNGRSALYEGEVAERIARAVHDHGGVMTADDLARHHADVLEPLSVDYRGDTVYETPPNSQGLILLEELRILEAFDLAAMGHLSPDAVHAQIEAKKLAFEDRERYAGDPAHCGFDPRTLLADDHIARRRADIDMRRAHTSAVATASTDTTSFVVVDASGNACSFIQSVFAPFGSAVCVPGLGIIMNNRMRGFSLQPGHPNALAPGKRTMHTLNTYMVFRGGRPYVVGNTPGGDFQVQTNLQVLTGILDFGLDPQAAIDAPRWGHTPGALIVEPDMPAATQRELISRGHTLRTMSRVAAPMGRAQAIVIDPETGTRIGASDTRGEGLAAGW
jgi:gamma-glutamyltranspeptidase/glutathione hydrolase